METAMLFSHKPPRRFGMRIREVVTHPLLREYMPDILSVVVFGLVVTVTRLRFPMKSGLLLSVLLRRIRVTPMQQHIFVSIDGLPSFVWSVRIPWRKHNDFNGKATVRSEYVGKEDFFNPAKWNADM
jgi:hypothetical protein